MWTVLLFHWHSSLFRFIQMVPQYFFYNLPASESKDVLQSILSQEVPRCHEEKKAPVEDQTHDRCVIQWPSDPLWSPEWRRNYKCGPLLAISLRTGAGCLLKDSSLVFFYVLYLQWFFVCFISILFSSDQLVKLFLFSSYFKIVLCSINVLQSASSSAWLWGCSLIVEVPALFFFSPHFFFCSFWPE